MDAAGLLLLIVTFAGLALLAGGGRSRREHLMKRQTDARLKDDVYRTTRTDATGVLTCRRCGAEGSERVGACARCGAPL